MESVSPESLSPESAAWPEPPAPRWPRSVDPGWPQTVSIWWPVLFGVLAALEVLGRISVRDAVPVSGGEGPFGQRGPDIHIAGTPTTLSAAAAVIFGVLCLLSTMPSGLLRPAVAGVIVTAASVVSLAAFAVLTVAGLVAQVLVAYRLGRSRSGIGGPSDPGRPAGSPPALGLGGWLGGGAGSQVLALVLGMPYLVLALAHPGRGEARLLIVLLAVLTPAAALAGIAQRREAEVASAAEQAFAGSLFEYMARGERARIARELHDVVAHHISMVAVQAETARLTTPGMPDQGAKRLLEIGDTARAGLTEMRRLLGVLREDALSATAETSDAQWPVGSRKEGGEAGGAARASRRPQPGLAQLNELLDEARDASGSAIRLIVSGPVSPLDPGVELAAYRIVQEALTNARRHAPGAAVDVELRYGSDALRLRIRDNGPGMGAANAAADPRTAPDARSADHGPHGHGLLGMRERAQSVGGELRAGPAAGGGFLVQATLPVTGQSAGTAA